MKILVIQTAFLGDVILATALLEKLHQYYPQAKIDFLVRKGNESVVIQHPFLHKTLTWEKKKNKYKNAYIIWQMIKRERYDILINTQRHSTTALISIFSKAKYIVGFRTTILSLFFSQSIPYIKKGIHEIQRNQHLITSITDPTPALPKIYFPQDIINSVQPYITATPYLTFSVGSVWKTKEYPHNKWTAFLLSIKKDYVIYFLGSSKEYAISQMIIERTRTNAHLSCVNLCGQLSILPSAALMQKAHMNYALDSAPTHMATAVNAPITTLFLSTDPIFGYYPLSDKSYIITTKENLPCRPCTNHGRHTCPKQHFHCANITSQQLLPTLT